VHVATGPKGGYRLTRPAAAITVLDVVEAIEGPASAFVCQEIRQRGTGAIAPERCRAPCAIHTVMTEADRAWRASLRSVTVADLLDRLPSGIRERNQAMLAVSAS
jgi:Rrf2 family protein